MKISTKVLLGLAAAVMAVGIAGCGGGSAGSKAASSAAGGKVLKVGTDATFKPFEWRNEAGEYTGFDIDLMNMVGWEANPVNAGSFLRKELPDRAEDRSEFFPKN